eukprot:403340662
MEDTGSQNAVDQIALLDQHELRQNQSQDIESSIDELPENKNQQLEGSHKSTAIPDGITYNEALVLAGGFGFFQYLACTTLIMIYMSTGYIFYSLAYLELFPDYRCKDGKLPCDRNSACAHDGRLIEIDWTSPRSLHNWIEKLDIECVESYRIGLLGSMYFAGWTISCLIVPRLADLYGRKWPIICCSCISFVLILGLILSNNLNLSIALFFFLGMCQTGKISTVYVMMLELIPQFSTTILGTIVQLLDGATLIWSSIYFRYISKDWLWFQVFGLCTCGVACVLQFFLPESPKYQYSKRNYNQARKGLAYIAKINRIKNYEDPTFDTEIDQLNMLKESVKLAEQSLSQKRNSQQSLKRQSTLQNQQQDQTNASPERHSSQELQQKLIERNDQSIIGGAAVDDGKIKTLLSNKRHLSNFLIILVFWIVSSFDYYLISFQMKYINGDIFINTIVSSVSEVIAYILSGAFYMYIGFRISFLVSFIIAIIGSLFYVIFKNTASNALISVMILGSKFGISASFNLVYLANSLFPPLYASTVMGLCNMFARVASMIAPQIAEVEGPVPMILFCIFAGVAAVLSLFIRPGKDQK